MCRDFLKMDMIFEGSLKAKDYRNNLNSAMTGIRNPMFLVRTLLYGGANTVVLYIMNDQTKWCHFKKNNVPDFTWCFK